MSAAANHPSRQAGESLVELLAAMTIVAIAITALMTALATHATSTGVNRDQSQASTTLLAAAEYVKSLDYSACDPATTKTVFTTEVPYDTKFSVTYGPGRAVNASTPCSSLTVVPIRVQGAGFTLDLEVVKRP